MTTHVVLFRFPDAEARAAGVAALRSLEGRVPSLRDIEVGVDTNRSERAWDVCLITRFDDRAGLDAYRDDPFHAGVKQAIAALGATSAVVDYEQGG